MGLVTAWIQPWQSICLSNLPPCWLVAQQELSTGLCSVMLMVVGLQVLKQALPQSQLPASLHPPLLGGNSYPRLSAILLHPAASPFGHCLQLWL